MFGMEFSFPDLINATLGGLIGAGVTWLWARRESRRTREALNTAIEYIPRATRDPESVGKTRKDKKGWPKGFDQILRGKAAMSGTATVEASGQVREADDTLPEPED